MNGMSFKKEETVLMDTFRKLAPEARHIVLVQAQAALRREDGAQRYERPDPAGLKPLDSSAV
jgi:hypothetical protein